MKRALLLAIVVALAATGCDRKWKYKKPDYFRTDSAMITHENPANKSSTGVGIPGY